MDKNVKDIDIVLLRKRRNRRRKLVKFSAFLLLAAVAVTVYAKRDEWYPKLEGIGSRFESVKSNGSDLAEGNFPLSISGGIDYQTGEINNCLAILSDAYLYIYDSDGDLYDERQHAYANAMLQTAGKKALVYESGGNKFRIESRSKTVYTKKIDNSIIFARLSESGMAAVVTNSDNYLCRITVFDETGNEIYSRDCVERVTDLDFSSDGKGCVIATCEAVNGVICSKITSVSFDSKTDNWVSEYIDTFCLKVFYGEKNVFVIGDTKCAYYDSKGQMAYTYEYPSNITDWDFSEDKAVMLFENKSKRHSYITSIDGEKMKPSVIEFPENSVRCVRIIDDKICVLNKDGITRYNFTGGGEKNISPEGSYDKFIFIDDYIFLLGYDRIDRTDYE
ncbi:MAG: DUF5711 family protein [Porcipelethomonas sp.]